MNIALNGALRASGMARVPGVAWVLLALLATFSTLSGSFLQAGNLANIIEQSVVLLIIALPMTLIVMSEGVDMSMGAVLTLCSVVLAGVLVSTNSATAALLAGITVGAVFGLLNGQLVAHVGLPPFIVTLGTMGVAQGAALILTDGDSVIIGERLSGFYDQRLVGLSLPLLLAAAAYGACHLLLYRSRFGLYVRAIGGNREALHLAGVRTTYWQVAVYVLGGSMAGLAALVMTARMSAGHPTAAIGMEFDAIAATIVGGTSFERGKGWLFGTLLGVVAVGVLRNGLNLLNVQSAVQVSCIGLLVIVALLLDSMKADS